MCVGLCVFESVCDRERERESERKIPHNNCVDDRKGRFLFSEEEKFDELNNCN